MTPTRIFISYSHGSDTHRLFVQQLAQRLRGDGLDCQIDQYVNGFPAEGWQRWMENSIEQSDFVLVVCTPLYLQRYRGQDTNGGRGVSFEGVVISQTLYDAYYRNTKFVPVLPEDGNMSDVPLPLKSYTAFVLPRDYQGLYRFLTGQASVPVPEIGERVMFGESTTAPHSIALPQSGQAATPSPPSPTLPPQGGQGDKSPSGLGGAERRESKMSDALKAAWIGAVVILLAALITGLFALFAAPNISTQGDCSGVMTGDVNASITQNCTNRGKP